MEKMEIVLEKTEEDKNNIELDEEISTFDKLKKLQMLIKKESSLKEICNTIFINFYYINL